MYNPLLKESLAVRARARPVTFSYVSIARLDTFQPQTSLWRLWLTNPRVHSAPFSAEKEVLCPVEWEFHLVSSCFILDNLSTVSCKLFCAQLTGLWGTNTSSETSATAPIGLGVSPCFALRFVKMPIGTSGTSGSGVSHGLPPKQCDLAQNPLAVSAIVTGLNSARVTCLQCKWTAWDCQG